MLGISQSGDLKLCIDEVEKGFIEAIKLTYEKLKELLGDRISIKEDIDVWLDNVDAVCFCVRGIVNGVDDPQALGDALNKVNEALKEHSAHLRLIDKAGIFAKRS